MNEAYSFSSSGSFTFVLVCVRTFALLHYTTDFSRNLAPMLRHESATRSRIFGSIQLLTIRRSICF